MVAPLRSHGMKLQVSLLMVFVIPVYAVGGWLILFYVHTYTSLGGYGGIATLLCVVINTFGSLQQLPIAWCLQFHCILAPAAVA